MSILRILSFNRTLPPALAGAVLTIAGFSAGTQGELNCPVKTLKALGLVAEPPPTRLQFPPSNINVHITTAPPARRETRKSMSRRPGQSGSLEKKGRWWRVRFRLAKPGIEKRKHKSLKVALVV